jgi:type IV pilus assembly protein PilC
LIDPQPAWRGGSWLPVTLFGGAMFFWLPNADFGWLFLVSVARLLTAGLLGWGGVAALRVAEQADRPDLTLTERTRQARENESLWLAILALAGLPLVVPASMALAGLWMLAAVESAFYTLVQRGRQNRLLWTLALAVRGGRNLADEVELLAQTETRRQQARLAGLVADLRMGTPLSRALLTREKLLPQETAAAIGAAEESGRLGTMLTELATAQTQELRTVRWNGSLNHLAIYANLLVGVYLSVTGFVMYYIIPKFKAIFEGFGVELPHVTVLLIQFADAFVSYWYLALPMLALPFLALFQALYLCVGEAWWTPAFVRGLWPRLTTPRILRSLGAAVQQRSGLACVMGSLAEATPERMTASRYDRVARRLEQGMPLGDALHAEKLVTAREAAAILRAEKLGHLPWALTALGDRIDSVRRVRLGLFVEGMKPALILALGSFVLLFAVAMFAPLVKLLNDLS